MTPKTMKSSGNPANRARIERGFAVWRYRLCRFNTILNPQDIFQHPDSEAILDLQPSVKIDESTKYLAPTSWVL